MKYLDYNPNVRQAFRDSQIVRDGRIVLTEVHVPQASLALTVDEFDLVGPLSPEDFNDLREIAKREFEAKGYTLDEMHRNIENERNVNLWYSERLLGRSSLSLNYIVNGEARRIAVSVQDYNPRRMRLLREASQQ